MRDSLDIDIAGISLAYIEVVPDWLAGAVYNRGSKGNQEQWKSGWTDSCRNRSIVPGREWHL